MARVYKKRSDYWNKFENKETNDLSSLYKKSGSEDFVPAMVGESLYETVQASRLNGSASRSKGRTNSITTKSANNRYGNIKNGLLPFEYSDDFVDAREAVELCQRAYFNIPSFRSTIDLLSDFSDQPLYLDGGSNKSKKFVKAWFERINIDNLKSQYFREYYRSGNVFLYRLDGKIKTNKPSEIVESYGSKVLDIKIPIKYMMLNPTDIAAKGSMSFDTYEYVKVLTPFEIARLSKPQNDHDKELLASLSEETRLKIKNKSSVNAEHVFMDLDVRSLHAIFAKKQDYEPLSIPYGFAVLDDINKKIELKKIDQAIARSIENVILLVTMGDEPEKGGINHANLKATQEIFQNTSVGRVFVSDYTTKADFVIPDLRKVVGPEKYEVLNRDIQDGLQNMLIGESKYSDGPMKMNVFLQRLEESRESFLREFLQKEIKRICKAAGFQQYPTAKFKVEDSGENKKLAIRMMELGVLTPEQGLKSIDLGELPSHEELDKAQEEFKEKRTQGHYMPLVNSLNIYQGEEGKAKPESTPVAAAGGGSDPTKKKKKDGNGNGLAPSGGRPMGTSNASKGDFSRKSVVETVNRINLFELKALRDFAIEYGVDEVEASKKELVVRVCESIIGSTDEDKWEEALASVVKDFTLIQDMDLKQEILEIGCRHQLGDRSSAILYHSSQIEV
jgi:hypothetical protein|tara:strand:+ start:5686 stop:7710 length:2025 start_codon:yes stop_codon:yes gene_type:complete